MTTEKPKVKRGRPKKAAATEAATTSSCNCEGQLASLRAQIAALQNWSVSFNTYLQQNMISNTADAAAERHMQTLSDEIQDSKG
ncbi:hypothetical protein CMI37_05005 [Candidatus Pacearchaeota archaeon]|nr:hypothetical protein [Candidatus Pacearchaeota archaeon]|tara:strand:+ start:8616 stop:8867 length:252 start_codon:yes stop_codon:yes gene_type:complete